ncbi:tyrosine-protein phosphatase [Spiribacter vilamensis]|uniref:protein-tyrosine-phosphatase n=1 Tax=Spiribacter vilamensis TaxID=531306 RepID=A0A4Q8D189_9GAMM|nr:CpsB/CapC family capsule biosynthesis tyrosine phosphatase [Spiribacter vilamensis]RZU99083.1 protein-tyrosine phosphatase [Spiribacter vilamensis]TVO61919.1 capsular biosynthesis protein [Spiribacter vilamensis]
MIDLHNHLLPGIDDGAEDMAEALAMARLAVADGVTHLVCTPHIHPGLYDNTAEGIDAVLRDYRQALDAAGVDLTVTAAAEVRFGLEVMTGAQAGTLPLLGEWEGQRVLLLEFPHTEIPFGAERLTEWLIARDIRPMIAHPERNRDIVNDPGKLRPFLEQGCLTQVTASALTGQFGPGSQSRAEQLVSEGAATCLASDAHNTGNRPPCLSRGVAAAAALIGKEAATTLGRDNPWRIVAGSFTAAAAS